MQGLKDIISFRWQREYMERFFRANDEYAQASMAYAERRSDESRRITLVMEAASLAADIAAVLLVTSGQIPALWLMPVFVLSSAIFTPILDALSMSTNYGLIFGAAQRVLGLFAEKPLVRDEGKRRLDMRGTAVEVRFEDVRFTYPAAKGGEPNPPVLNGLSFSFRTGETVALVGASGGGQEYGGAAVAAILGCGWRAYFHQRHRCARTDAGKPARYRHGGAAGGVPVQHERGGEPALGAAIRHGRGDS